MVPKHLSNNILKKNKAEVDQQFKNILSGFFKKFFGKTQNSNVLNSKGPKQHDADRDGQTIKEKYKESLCRIFKK